MKELKEFESILDFKKYAKNLVAENLDSAFRSLKPIVEQNSDLYNSWILYKGRHKDTQAFFNQNLFNKDKLDIERNKVRNSILQLIDSLSESDFQNMQLEVHLNEKLQKIQVELKNYEKKVESLTLINNKIKQDKEVFFSELEEQKSLNDNKIRELQLENEKLKNLAKNYEEAKKQVQNNEKLIEKLKFENYSLNESNKKLSQHENTIQKNLSLIKNLSDEKEKLLSEVQNIREQEKNLLANKNDIEKLKNENLELKNRITNINNELQEKDNKYNKKVSQYENTIQKNLGIIESLSDVKEELQNEMQSIKEQEKKLRSENLELNSKIVSTNNKQKENENLHSKKGNKLLFSVVTTLSGLLIFSFVLFFSKQNLNEKIYSLNQQIINLKSKEADNIAILTKEKVLNDSLSKLIPAFFDNDSLKYYDTIFSSLSLGKKNIKIGRQDKVIRFYRVQLEGAFKIAQKFDMTLENIKDLNPEVKDINNLKKGELIRVFDIVKYVYHEIKKGESFISIEKKYNMWDDEIMKINGITDKDVIKVGENLIVFDSKYFKKMDITTTTNEKSENLQ